MTATCGVCKSPWSVSEEQYALMKGKLKTCPLCKTNSGFAIDDTLSEPDFMHTDGCDLKYGIIPGNCVCVIAEN